MEQVVTPPVDTRTDEEILDHLQSFKPIDPSNEKNIWAFWDQGLSKCPPWCQRNIIGWVRRHGRDWTVRVLDAVEGSANHYANYVDNSEAFFPTAFLEGSMTGPHIAPHTSDLIRLPLLYIYGGVWLDVSILLFRNLDRICWDVLQDPQNPAEMVGFKITMGATVGMFFNGFIAARKSCAAIKYWHDTFLELWKGADSTEGMAAHPLLRHLPRYEPPSLNGKMPPFQYAQFADYLAQVLCFERLRHLTDPDLGWDGPVFVAKNVLLFDCVPEMYWAQRLTEWNGRKQFELLTRQREGVPHDEAYEEAEMFVNDILRTSSTMKVSHGLKTAGREYLAEIWDKPENSSADCTPGTFAEHLRWASVRYENPKPLVAVPLPLREEALLKGPLLKVSGEPRLD